MEKKKRETLGWVRLQKTRDGKREFYPVSFADGTQGILNINKDAIVAVKNGTSFETFSGDEVQGEYGKTIVGSIVKSDDFKGKAATPKKKAAVEDDDSIPF